MATRPRLARASSPAQSGSVLRRRRNRARFPNTLFRFSRVSAFRREVFQSLKCKGITFAPRRNWIPLHRARPSETSPIVNDANVERLRILPKDERHLRRGARVSDSKVTSSLEIKVASNITAFDLEFVFQGLLVPLSTAANIADLSVDIRHERSKFRASSRTVHLHR